MHGCNHLSPALRNDKQWAGWATANRLCGLEECVHIWAHSATNLLQCSANKVITREPEREPGENPSEVRITNESRYFKSYEFKHKYDQTRNKTTEYLSMICINANNLKYNFDKINDYLEELGYPWDIIGCSETFLKNGDPSLHICHYTFVGNERKDKAGGGVAFFVHNGITFERRKDLTVQVKDCETPCNSLFIEVTGIASRNIIFGVIYSPSFVRKNHMGEFRDSVANVFAKIAEENKVLFIMGDFNINLLDRRYKKFLNAVFNYNYKPLINRSTRVCITETKESRTLIDNIYTNAKYATADTGGILLSAVSDHFPIFQFISLDKVNNAVNWKVSIEDKQAFKTHLKNEIAYKTINGFSLTDTKLVLSRETEKFYRWTSKIKSDYYITKFQNDEVKREIINFINVMIKDKFKCSKPCACICTSEYKMAHMPQSEFTYQYFCGTRKEFVKTPSDGLFTDTTSEEIVELIHQIIKDNSHLSLHRFCPQLITEDLNLTASLSKVFNQSLREGKSPDYSSLHSLKEVVEQWQVWEKCVFPQCDDIFEKIVCKLTKNLLDKNKLTYNNPHLFETQKVNKMAYLVNNVQRALNDKLSPIGVFFSLKRSEIDSGILPTKLKKTGIYGALLNWLSSYFKSRYQNTPSTCNSSLLDLLYAIVMTDISDYPIIVNQNEIVIICTNEKKVKKLVWYEKLKETMDNLYKELDENGLSVERCCYIRFRNEENNGKPVQDQTAPKESNEKFKRVEKTTFCGISIDSGVNFHTGDEMHACEEQKVIDECRKRNLLPPEVLTAAQLCCMNVAEL